MIAAPRAWTLGWKACLALVLLFAGLAQALIFAPTSPSNQALAAGTCAPRQSSYSGVISATPGLLGYWRLGESSGTVACDSTAHNNGTYLGGVTLGAPGAIAADPDTAVTLDGSSGQVSVPATSTLNVGDTLTIEAWVKRGTSKAESNEVIASKQEGSWVLMFNESNQLTLRRSTYGEVATAKVATTDTTNWHYVVATKNGSSVHLYLDGVDVTGTVTNQTLTDNNLPMVIGQSSDSAFLKGAVDETALYSTALTPAQISQHYNAAVSQGTLSPPSNLSASAGNAQVALSWTASPSSTVAGYKIYRANPDGSWPSTALATVSSSTLAYTDSGLTNGTAYTYRVTAYDSTGSQSSPSNQASATPTTSCTPRQSSYSGVISATPGLLGYWRLGESSGTVACDSTAHNNGTYLGGVTLGAPGAIAADPDTAVTLDGSSGQVSVPAAATLNVGDKFTVEAWVKRGATNTGANEVIASKQEGSWVLMFNESNQLTLRRSTVGNVATATVATTDTSSWHYVVATKNGSSVHLYIDGVDVTGTVTNQTLTDNTQPLVIGQSAGGSFIKASIDETALYNTPLTSAQVSQHYAAGKPMVGPMPGELTALSPATVETQSKPIGIVVSPDGKSAYLSYEGGKVISQYSRNVETGKLTALSPSTVTVASEPRSLAISSDSKSVYVANFGSDKVSQFSRNTETGKLTALSPSTVATGDSPHGIEVSSDGKSAYVANYSGNSISQYSRNTETGKLTALSPATVAAANSPNGVAISADGKSVYTADRGSKAVSQYSRNTETGKLTVLAPATVGAGELPHDVAISPDGNSIYVTNSGSATVSQYSRNPETGKLTALSPATIATGSEPFAVTISSDSRSAYVSDSGIAAVSQYSRNTETGALTPLAHSTVASGMSPYGVIGSADGKFVYVANEASKSVSQYARALP